MLRDKEHELIEKQKEHEKALREQERKHQAVKEDMEKDIKKLLKEIQRLKARKDQLKGMSFVESGFNLGVCFQRLCILQE